MVIAKKILESLDKLTSCVENTLSECKKNLQLATGLEKYIIEQSYCVEIIDKMPGKLIDLYVDMLREIEKAEAGRYE